MGSSPTGRSKVEEEMNDISRTNLDADAFIEIGLKYAGNPIWFLRGMTIFSNKRLIRDILDRKLRRDKRVVEYKITSSYFVITQRKAI